MSDVRRMNVTEVLRIERKRLTEEVFVDECGNRCALGWWLLARDLKTPQELGDDELFYQQNRRAFTDLIQRFGERGSVDWWRRVIVANNHERGRERERQLRDLFAQAGVRVVFSGRANQ